VALGALRRAEVVALGALRRAEVVALVPALRRAEAVTLGARRRAEVVVFVPVLRRARLSVPLAVAERRERLDEAGGCREPLRPVMGRPRGTA
jgi:hypothetical protein